MVFRLFLKFGVTPHYAEALDGMDDGAEMKVDKLAKREQKNFTFATISRDESINPEEQHEQGRGNPDRDSDIDNELQHFLKSPFLLYIYNTIFGC